VSKILKN